MQEFTLNCPGQNERTKIARAIFLVCVLFIRTETTNNHQICQSFESVNTSQKGVCHILQLFAFAFAFANFIPEYFSWCAVFEISKPSRSTYDVWDSTL